MIVTQGQGIELAQEPSSIVIPRAQWGLADKYALTFTHQACGNLKDLRLEVHLDTGPDHAAASSTTFTTEQQVTVTVSSTGGQITPSTFKANLSISQTKPEQWRLLDISRFLGDNSKNYDLTIRVSVPTAPTVKGSDIASQRIVVRCVPTYEAYVSTAGPVITPAAVVPAAGYEQTLSWTSGCPLINSYQVQLLHKPVKVARTGPATALSVDNSYDPDATPAAASPEWELRGMLLETGSALPSYRLTLAEGDGTYHWRVRAIGTQPGGVANPDNWGPWSDGQKFSVTAPDAASNWIYSRTFSEGGHFAEKLTFATGLQQVRQTQTRLTTPTQSSSTLGQQVVAVQTVQDFAGRDAVTSLPIPIQGADATKLGFKPVLLAQTTGVLYEARHFDQTSTTTPADNTAREPMTAVEQAYYSRTNGRVADAEGYPFTRTVFSNDGTNRVIEQGGVGASLRVRSSGAHTVRTSYASVAPHEVLRLFGQDSPQVDGLYKIITTDPNNISSITYQTKDGKTIATALSGAGSEGAALENLPSAGATTAITEAITGKGQIISKLLTLTEPQTLIGSYTLTPAQLRNACANYCSSCDYQVILRILDVNADPGSAPVFTSTIVVKSADQCTPANIDIGSANIPLAAGTYKIERELVPIDYYPIPVGNTLGSVSRTLAEHLTLLRTSLNAKFENIEPWSKISFYLDPARNQVDELYRYLEGKSYAEEDHDGQNCYKIPVAGCDDFVYFPILTDVCPPPCDLTAPDFEAQLAAALSELNDRYPSLKPFDSNSVLAASGYQNGEFDALVQHMAAATQHITPSETASVYRCEDLKSCWSGILAQLETALYKTKDLPPGYKFDLVQEFLNCTELNLTTPVADARNFDRTYAFEQFVYNPTLPAHINCIRAVGADDSNLDPNQELPALSYVLANFTNYPRAKRNQVAGCILNANNQGHTAPTITEAEAQAQANLLTQKGKESCENRRDEFKRVLIQQFHQQGRYVEGDVYAWQPGTGATGEAVPTITTEELGAATEFISACEVESFVQDLVEKCQNECVLTVVETTDTNSGTKLYQVGTLAEQASMRHALFSSLYVYAKTGQEACPTSAAGQLPWQGVVKSGKGGTRMGVSAMTRTLLAAIGKVTLGANQISGQVPRPNPGNCSDDLNEVNEKFPDLFSLSTSLDNWHFNEACAVVGEPSYVTILDARTDQNHSVSRSDYSFDTDYVLITERNNPNSVVCPPTATAGPLPIAGCVPLSDVVDTTKPHYYIRFIDPTTRTPFSKAQIRAVSEPYIGNSHQFPVGRTSNNSEGIFVRLLIDAGAGPVWREAAVMTISENAVLVVADGDYVIDWKYVEMGCPVTTSAIQLCSRWSLNPPAIEIGPDGPPVFDPQPEDCNKLKARRLLAAYQGQRDLWVQTQLTAFNDHFQQQCVALASQQETFTIQYSLGYHHFTLYYYDRAGNLTKTVPPSGVAPLTLTAPAVASLLLADRSTWPLPPHRLATTYTYNSLHQLEKQDTPDGGETHFFYNRKGQLRFSQNARQRVASLPSYSYTRYDALGRVTEVGETFTNATGATGPELPLALAQLDNMSYPPTDEVRQVTRTFYGVPPTLVTYLTKPQRNLTNRVAYSCYDVDGNPTTETDNSYTYYSYDVHGNVEWLGQKQYRLGTKFVRYKYDLISNKVTQVRYQEGQADQFYHRYSYDGDNRLTQVQTSSDSVIWDQDARYEYFAHGPLKRLELGEDHVQGIDYTYTLQGWLKGINHLAADPGQDGTATGLTVSAKDAFGMALGYYTGDYTTNNPAWVNGANSVLQPANSLYNGNIAAWTSKSRVDLTSAPTAAPGPAHVGEQYRYDQLNRIVSSAQANYNNASGTFVASQDYGTAYTYDPNGNLQSLTRRGASSLPGQASTQQAMDELTYLYDTQTGHDNRLLRVNDPTPNQPYYDDIKQTTLGDTSPQYAYDAIGNLTSDATSGVTSIQWNVYGKIESVIKAATAQATLYGYDAQGNRIRKSNCVSNLFSKAHTYYVRDAQGNVLAIYEQQEEDGTFGPIALTEQPLYGSSRLGLRKLPGGIAPAAAPLGYYARTIGQKQYELTDHLGNVRALVSDIKRPDDAVSGTYKPDLLSYYNYYPFGMMQPGRSAPSTATQGGGYRYGFNGKEKDNNGELGLTAYDYGFRIYNPSIAKFLSVDPLASQYPKLTPYQFASNTPIQAIDVDGLEGYISTSSMDIMGKSSILKTTITLDVYYVVNSSGKNAMHSTTASSYTARDGKDIKSFLESEFNIALDQMKPKEKAKLDRFGDIEFVFNIQEYDASKLSTTPNAIANFIEANSIKTDDGRISKPLMIFQQTRADIHANGVTNSRTIVASDSQAPASKTLGHEVLHYLLTVWAPRRKNGRLKDKGPAEHQLGGLMSESIPPGQLNAQSIMKILESLPSKGNNQVVVPSAPEPRK